jgi:hypothetical protein
MRENDQDIPARGELVEPRAEPLVLRQAQDERMYQTVKRTTVEIQ